MIEDNFLDKKEFDELQNFLMGNRFSWYYNPMIDFHEDEDKYQFIHVFYDSYVPTSKTIEIIKHNLEEIDLEEFPEAGEKDEEREETP